MIPTDKAAIEGLMILAANADQGPFESDTAYNLRRRLIVEGLIMALPALQRLLAGETREADKPAGVPVAELEDLKRQVCDVASAPIMKSTTKTQLDKGYELALRAAYRDFADELQSLISRHQDPHHG